MEKNVQNMVRVTDSITSSFKKLKFVTVGCLVLALASVIVSVVYSIGSINSLNNKVYVLDHGQAFSASRQDVNITREDEIISQSERFHSLFFTVSPNQEVLKANLESSLNLCADRSVFDYYNDIRESGFYSRMSQANAVQEIVVDSVKTDVSVYPYQVVAYSSLYITRPSLITRSELVTTYNMIDVTRDVNNLNGLKIENFRVVSNVEAERRKR